MGEQDTANEPAAGGWRLNLGIATFALSIILPVAGIPTVAALGLSGTLAASVSGGLLVGAEVLGILAIAVMGKPGFAWLKSRIFGLLRRYGPPAQVSVLRYRIGLVMFIFPMVTGWLLPYLPDRVHAFIEADSTIYVLLDLVWFASFFVLGGDFWDKIRALFVTGAKAQFPQPATNSLASQPGPG